MYRTVCRWLAAFKACLVNMTLVACAVEDNHIMNAAGLSLHDSKQLLYSKVNAWWKQ